ncbi:hypothetical protein J5N97_022595 [Dioscorea zingiberensis]|uniref:Uncharacterized protein n=1 Tax=Dioscorea zingiberensis TaxID=325984 RepID=A0A9D5CAP9_9LILI|nr:hypothetical protein J5N97_022595 [Dioscorea zingiberensis]
MPPAEAGSNTAVIGSILDPKDPPPPVDPDLPADSIKIRIDDGFDWSALSAAVFTREYSTKGSTNPKSMIHSHPNTNALSTSQRFSMNTKPRAPIIGLTQVGYDGPRRQGIGRGPRRDQLAPAPAYVEPASPKVSCLGRVSSEKYTSPEHGKFGCWSGFPPFRRVRSGRRRGSELESRWYSGGSECIPTTAAPLPGEEMTVGEGSHGHMA